MNPAIEATIKEVEKLNESIRDALNSKNITNTGEAARSLRIEHGDDFVRSIGIFYLEFLDTGRGTGKFPPSEPIEKWVRTKLGISSINPEFDGIVFVIRKKIAELGTEIFRNNSKGIELDEKIVTLRENLSETLRETTVFEINQRLDKFKKAHLKNKYGL